MDVAKERKKRRLAWTVLITLHLLVTWTFFLVGPAEVMWLGAVSYFILASAALIWLASFTRLPCQET